MDKIVCSREVMINTYNNDTDFIEGKHYCATKNGYTMYNIYTEDGEYIKKITRGVLVTCFVPLEDYRFDKLDILLNE